MEAQRQAVFKTAALPFFRTVHELMRKVDVRRESKFNPKGWNPAEGQTKGGLGAVARNQKTPMMAPLNNPANSLKFSQRRRSGGEVLLEYFFVGGDGSGSGEEEGEVLSRISDEDDDVQSS